MSLGTLILCVVLQKYLTLHSSEGLLEGGPFSHIYLPARLSGQEQTGKYSRPLGSL